MATTSNNITEIFNRDDMYRQSIRTFPSDIFASFNENNPTTNPDGTEVKPKINNYHGHWMLININVQDNSNFASVTRNGTPQSIYNGQTTNFTRTELVGTPFVLTV